MRAPNIAPTTLAAYLGGQQADQEWALIDNLDADEVRELAKLAIQMLWDANKAIMLASMALDDMTPRRERFLFRDQTIALVDPYLDALSLLLGVE